MTVEGRPEFEALPLMPGTMIRSAWGHYGADDELGAVNLLTSERVREAAACVVTGERIVLQMPLDQPDPPFYGQMAVQHSVFTAYGGAMDDRLYSFYPQSGTQWDALAHFSHPAAGFYNGFTRDQIVKEKRLGIGGPASRGIVGRGVLLDVASVLARRGTPLAPDQQYVIDAELLSTTAEAHGVALRVGDIVCIRTGWVGYYKGLDAKQRHELSEASNVLGFESPGIGPGPDIPRFVWDHGIVALAVDNSGTEPAPPPMDPTDPTAPALDDLCHTNVMVALGVHLGEFFDLEALGRACQIDGRYDFLFVSTPLWINGGIGSPPNALAIR